MYFLTCYAHWNVLQLFTVYAASFIMFIILYKLLLLIKFDFDEYI